MDIRGLMQFRLGQISSLTFTPNAAKDPTASLKLSAELTPELAEKMRCREAVFRPDGKPHPNVTRLDLGGATLRDVDLSLPSGVAAGAYDTYRPEDISSFRVEVDGMLVRLYMLARIKGRYLELVDFLEKLNTENFDLAIRSAQQEFDWSGKGGAGDRIELNGGIAGKKEGQGPLFQPLPCVHCDTEVPKNEDGRHMLNGELVRCLNEPSNEGEKQEVATGPALPPIHETNGGRRKRQATRGDVAQMERDQHPEQRGDIAGDHHPADDGPVFPVN